VKHPRGARRAEEDFMQRIRVLPLALLLPLAGVIATTAACPDGGEGEGEGEG
jgi:hypothetical protein